MDEYLKELKNKFGYNDELLKAIEITINLMIDEYGVDQQSEIYSLFANVKIYALDKVDKDILDEINAKMRAFNPHIIFEDANDPYEGSPVASSYTYDPIFNANMKVMDEVKFIVTEDRSNLYNGDEYRRVFGTSINMPYFIHEANHAYAMMHPEYKYIGNKIFVKHGMFTSSFEYTKGINGKYNVKEVQSDDIILEEMANEKITQDMLVKLLKKNNYKEVKEVLNSIHHVGTEYSCLMIALEDKLEELLGKDALMDYRRNHNQQPIMDFNTKASTSDIALEYFNGSTPFDYFRDKMHEIFMLNVNKFKMKIEDYAYESAKLLVEGMAPLAAYEEIAYQTTNLEYFNKRRDHILGQYPQYKNNGLSN